MSVSCLADLLKEEASMTTPDSGNEVSRESSRRETVVDRRSGLDRRALQDAERDGLSTNLERRRGPGRRRTDFMKSAEEGEMTQEQFMFVMAIDVFKRVN